MIKIAIILPYASLANLAQEVFEEHTAYMREHYQDLSEYSMELLIAATTDEILLQTLDCDAIIVRGGTYYDLCKKSTSVPLVELILSGTDIVNMLIELQTQYGDMPAAVLGTQNMVLGIESLANQLGVNATAYILQENTQQEIIKKVDQAAAEGKKVIVGGRTGCGHAEKLGLPSLLIPSGRDSFWNAISEAKQLAKISIQERERALGFQTLLDNAYEGLIALDRNGKIFFINSSAIRILQLSSREQYLNQKFSKIFSSTELNRILSSTDEYINEIIPYKSTYLSIKKLNLSIRGIQTGSVITFLNASQIRDAEGKLRGKLHQKGHAAKYRFDDLITRSPCMLECIREAKAFARTDTNVVITGESGTGKELISQSIHNWSNRSKGSFVALNCAALPENLLESELFGYVEGAFTGASKGGKAGMFELAHNGTLFLDEISEIPLDLQGRLLRVLQEREIRRLGDNKITPIDVRIIAATNRNLAELVREGKFRNDLYYRLCVLQLNLPPLRERKGDIPLLMQHFIRQTQGKEGIYEDIILNVQDYRLLEAQPWYGNIRELINFCQRLVVLNQPDVPLHNLVQRLLSVDTSMSTPKDTCSSSKQTNLILQDYSALQSLIEECGGNKTLAAKHLGISRVTLWRLLKKHESNTEP